MKKYVFVGIESFSGGNPCYIILSRYNDRNEYRRSMEGVFSNGRFSGTGDFNGNTMTFSL